MSTTTPPSSGTKNLASKHPDSESVAWQLIHNDVFDRILNDDELDHLVFEQAKTSTEPHADLLRLMLGMSLSEDEARTLFGRVVDHRQEMSHALGRPVHVRVAALDLLTTRRRSGGGSAHDRRESRPIMVAPAVLERALEEASSDGVTGLPRGPLFTNLLEHELRQRRRRVVVVFIDLDGFKNVNDEHGHGRGDDVLRTMATAAHSVLRRGDVLARLGGDEFALMLLDVSPEEASAAVDRLRSRFEELTAPLKTSFSAGIAVADHGVPTLGEEALAEDLIHRADRAMYEQKRQRASTRPEQITR